MVTGTPMQSAAMALNAGCDLNCGNTYLYILNAYHHGMVTEEAITEAAVRLLQPVLCWDFLMEVSMTKYHILKWNVANIF